MESLDWFTTKSQGPLLLAQFWQQRAALAEKELSVLKEQSEKQQQRHHQLDDSTKRLSSDQANEAPPPIMDTPLDVMGRPSLLELAAKEKEVQTLIEDVQKLQSTLNQLRESSARQLSHFEEELQVRSRHIQRLEAQLEAQKDYKEIRRELSILKSIEFPHHHNDGEDEDDDQVSKQQQQQQQKQQQPLEVLLLERNKALQSENTALKVAHSELQDDESNTRPVATTTTTTSLEHLEAPPPTEETSPPSPPPSSSSSASPGPANSSAATATNPNDSSDTMPASSTTRLNLSSNRSPASSSMSSAAAAATAAAAAAAAAAASVGVGPPPPFSPFVGASTLGGPRHIPPVFHPVLGLGNLGHFFNEDMLLHWRRSLEASMIQQQQHHMQQHHHEQQQQHSRPSSPGGASGSDNGSPEDGRFGNRTPTNCDTPMTAPPGATTPTPVNTSSSSTAGVVTTATTLPGWPSWEDSHLARLQQEFIARGGVYPGFNGMPSNGLGGGNGGQQSAMLDGESPAGLASLMSLPEGLTSLLAKSNPLEARLQEMLRATMERYASQALDTLAISRGVRELLSMHNIGQRLFAKFVLGLSQGTVSELLSKPKPWDKLTEKGRDSYRKMHAWACDEAAILLLKSLIPRKGKETTGSSVPSKSEESAVTEERIAHILHEASAALRAQQVSNDDSASEDSKSPSQAQTPSPGPKMEPLPAGPLCLTSSTAAGTSALTTATTTTSSSSSTNNNNNNNNSSSSLQQQQQQRRGRKPDHDDISQEQVLRIYQDELAKMMSGSSSAFGQSFNPSALSALTGGAARANAMAAAAAASSNLRDYNRSYTSALFERTPEEIRLALDVYQQELNRLMQGQATGAAAAVAAVTVNAPSSNANSNAPLSNGFPQDLSIPKSAAGGARSDEEDSERGVDVKSNSKSMNKSMTMENGMESSRKRSASPAVTVTVKTENSPSVFMASHSLHNILRPSSSPSPSAESGSTTATSTAAAAAAAAAVAAATGGNNGGVASPLQRIASITNSLMSQPSNPTLPQVTQRPMKAILPPITQQQFDTYQNLNTEDIVKKVKEQLSQYSISQRLFGESVLGLSQGSVSDLLARPKPWHMLTQKGREPFIRMKIFLEDENAVHKLVASQYKIAPEKLMRTGGYSGSPQSAALKNAKMMSSTGSSHSTSSPAMSGSNSASGGIGSLDLSPNSLAHSALAMHGLTRSAPHHTLSSLTAQHGAAQSGGLDMSGRGSPCPTGLNYGATLAHFMALPRAMPQAHHMHSSTPSTPHIKSEKNSSSSSAAAIVKNMPSTPSSHSLSNGLAPSPRDDSSTPTPGQGVPTLAAYSLPAHSVYELAALTQDLDTQGMTTKIKEVLLANNIGQKIFGEAVLGLSQGSVSELLSKPKPWHMLSIKGREPFIRMQLWLSDPRNIEHIQRLKSERREAGKRRRDLGFPMGGDGAPNSNASSNTNSFMGGDNSSNDGSVGGSPSPCGGGNGGSGGHIQMGLHHLPGASISSSSPSPAKKQRILFSEQQKEALKLAFSLDPYPSTSAMEFLAQELNLSTRTITNWFHNHRMRLKQQQSSSDKEEISPVNGASRESSGQFDPIHFRLLFHQRMFEMQAASAEESSGVGGGVGHPATGLPPSLAGLPPQLAGNLNMMASLGMPYPFYTTGMLSQFCMGLGNPSTDMIPGAEGLDLTLGRQRVALGQSDSDAEESDDGCESDDSSSRTDRRSVKNLSPLTMISPVYRKPLTAAVSSSSNSNNHAVSSSQESSLTASAKSLSTSRRSRKPAAPQWVNPHWQQSPSTGRDDQLQQQQPRDRTDDADERSDRKPVAVIKGGVDANLNNCVDEAVDLASVKRKAEAADDEDDDGLIDEDQNDDDREPTALVVKATSRGSSPSPSSPPTSDVDDDVRMEDESAKDDDNEQC